MKRHANWWTLLFLGLTGVVVGLEVVGSVNEEDNLWAWTNYIVEYIPGEVTAFLIAGLSGWLAVHFYRRYRDKEQDEAE